MSRKNNPHHQAMNMKQVKPLAITLALLAVFAILVSWWISYSQPRAGSRYIYVNYCNYTPDPWVTRPVPYAQIITVQEVSNKHVRCFIASIDANGESYSKVGTIPITMLGERISR